MNDNQNLADVCAVKVPPLERMLAAYDGPVVGTHPLFGPEPPEGQLRVAVCPGRDAAAQSAVSLYFADLDLVPFKVEAAEHDRAMAYIQGLNFVTTVSFLSATAGLEGIDRFVTPSFRRRLAAAEKMVAEDVDLFEAIFESNPFSQEAVRLFRAHLNLAAGGDVSLLAERAKWWWEPREGEDT
jgi:prephenate dehydrogenase